METHMQDAGEALPWDNPGWNERVEAWIRQELGSHNIKIHGPINFLHKRAWSAFASIPTSVGAVYFKAPAPPLRFEAMLTRSLAEIRPDCMAQLISIQPDEGWMLMHDSGVMLRQLINSVEDLHHWHHVLPIYAEFQCDVTGHLPSLLDTGIPDRRLASFPALYQILLQDTANLRVGLLPGLSGDEHKRLLNLMDKVSEQRQQLASLNLPETICHEEVHDANVIVKDDGYCFVDWGDSCIGHPFFTMLVTIRSAAFRLKLNEFAHEMVRLRDVYLEAWTQFAPIRDLRDAFQTAYQLAMINRSLSYQRVLGPLPDGFKVENDAISGWLQEYLEAISIPPWSDG